MTSEQPLKQFDAKASHRISSYLRACMERHNLSAEEFINGAGSPVHPKTLAAMINLDPTDTRCWEAEKAFVLFSYATTLNGYPIDRLWSAIVDGVQSFRWFDNEAPFVRYYQFSHRKATELDQKIRFHERTATVVRFFGRVLTCGFMPERMVRHYLKARYTDASIFTPRVLEGIRRFERDRYESIFVDKTTKNARHERYLAHFEFYRLLRREAPCYHLMHRDDIDEFVERLKVAVMNEEIVFGLTHGAPTKGDTAYRWMLHFESLTTIDNAMLIRHEAHRPYMTISERQPDPEWNVTLNRRLSQMGTLPKRTIHRLDVESTLDAIDAAVEEHFDRPSS